MTETIILFGASSAIAQAYIDHLQKTGSQAEIICISRAEAFQNNHSKPNISHYQSDYSSDCLKQIVDTISNNKSSPRELSQVVIFNGILHNTDFTPEKKLEEINVEQFSHTMHTNALVPITCLMSVLPLLNHQSRCTITALSARVGSINDNKLGGWYSYRASKAALNMLFKTAAIELARRAKNTRLILFHPGTTDTSLSKPFQKNVPKGKLFSPEFVAEQIATIIETAALKVSIAEPLFLDWQGEKINW